EDHLIDSALLDSDSTTPNLKYCAIPRKTSRCKKRHPSVLENPFWASRLTKGVRFDDKGRVMAVTDVIRPRQRMDTPIKVAWNTQTNKPNTEYG
ncbi:hypothetical protein TSMEX_003806, partial [Taenia solium]